MLLLTQTLWLDNYKFDSGESLRFEISYLQCNEILSERKAGHGDTEPQRLPPQDDCTGKRSRDPNEKRNGRRLGGNEVPQQRDLPRA